MLFELQSLSYTCEVNDGKTTVELTATKSGDKVICGDHQVGNDHTELWNITN